VTVCLTGCYTIHVLYANTPICGSPFCVEVFDPFAVHFVGHIPHCFGIGKPATFKGNVACINDIYYTNITTSTEGTLTDYD